MVYVINGKYYIKISGYYKEVKIVKEGTKYSIKRIFNSESIIVGSVENVSQMSLSQAYKKNKLFKD